MLLYVEEQFQAMAVVFSADATWTLFRCCHNICEIDFDLVAVLYAVLDFIIVALWVSAFNNDIGCFKNGVISLKNLFNEVILA